MRLLRDGGEPLRIGHRGAAALAPENTLAGVEAALAAGLDGIELDVVAVGGRVAVAHSLAERTPETPTLDDTLSLVLARAREDLLVVLDVKGEGFEEHVVASVRRYGLVERTLVASFHVAPLRAVRLLEPRLETARAYPHDRLGIERRVPDAAVATALAAMRRALPLRIGGMLARAGARVATLHHLVVSQALVRRCHTLGAPVVAWTVNDAAALERVASLGVDAVITDDPRIFAPAGTSAGPPTYYSS